MRNGDGKDSGKWETGTGKAAGNGKRETGNGKGTRRLRRRTVTWRSASFQFPDPCLPNVHAPDLPRDNIRRSALHRANGNATGVPVCIPPRFPFPVSHFPLSPLTSTAPFSISHFPFPAFPLINSAPISQFLFPISCFTHAQATAPSSPHLPAPALHRDMARS